MQNFTLIHATVAEISVLTGQEKNTATNTLPY